MIRVPGGLAPDVALSILFTGLPLPQLITGVPVCRAALDEEAAFHRLVP